MQNAIVLKDKFNPNSLLKKPGVYAAISDSKAYPLLWGLQEAGFVKQIGEYFPEPGKKAIVVQVGKPSKYQNNPIQEEDISLEISVDFFTNATQAYPQWQRDWWREAIQNAVDAGATKIELGAVKQENGTWRIWCDDNGKGMTKDILRKVFFAVGASGKKSTDTDRPTIGGFGKAKEVLLLPWIEFKIVTKDLIATSKPLNIRTRENFSSLTSGNPMKQGTRLEVVMPADKFTKATHAIALLKKCYLPNVDITIVASGLEQGDYENNITKTYSLKADLKHGKNILELKTGNDPNPIAILYFTKPEKEKKYVLDKITEETRIQFRINNPNTTSIIVRSGGVLMFELPLDYSIQGLGVLIIDLVARRDVSPRDIFTDNRNAFKDPNIVELIEEYKARLLEKREEALIAQSSMFTMVFEGSGAFAPHVMEKKSKYRAGNARARIKTKSIIDEVGTVKIEVEPTSIEEAAKGIDEEIEREARENPAPPPEERTKDIITNPSGDVFKAMMDMTKQNGEEQIEIITKQAAWKPHFMLHNEIEGMDPKSKYYPERMAPSVIKLAKYWTDICRWVLGQLGCERQFGVGFLFSETAAAMHVHDTSQIVEDWLLINPVNIIRKGKENEPWRLSDEEHIRYLYAAAIHEATHMVDRIYNHMTEFAYAITVNMAVCADLNKAKRFLSYVRISEKLAGEGGESSERPSHKRAGRAELEQETGVFKPDPSVAPTKGRTRKIFEIGNRDFIQIRYMWNHSHTDMPKKSTSVKLEMYANGELIFSNTEEILVKTLNKISEYWSNLAYNHGDTRFNLFPFLRIEQENESEYIIRDMTKQHEPVVVSREFLVLLLKELAERIAARLNFTTAVYSEAKEAFREWKRVKDLRIQ